MNLSEEEWQLQNAAMSDAPAGTGGPRSADLACYALIARVFAERPRDQLPDDFARQTAALVQDARRQRSWRASNVALLILFATLTASCLAAARFVPGVHGEAVVRNFAALCERFTLEPWMLAGLASLGVVQAMNLRSRVRV